MNILILGGDGYLGWPTAMYFSQRGHDVTIVDNYFRRNNCQELDVPSLYPTPPLEERTSIWEEKTGKQIKVIIGDLTDPEIMRGLFSNKTEYSWPQGARVQKAFDTIIHYAEQPSAPFSVLSYKHANTTLSNNLLITNNLMFAVKDFSPDTHIVHIGTMGEYGTPNIDIEEGWLEISHKGRKDTFLFPRQASSIYHTSKIMDTDLMWFGIRTWGLRMTELMQGPVYGMETEESEGDPRLRTLFNYDEIFGTVINRFITQAVVGYPLTVYGKGGQTRGYLNIRDTLQCVYQSAMTPAEPGELRIFNQIMETFSVNELAEMTQRVGNALGYDVKVQQLDNPRKEAEEHYYNPQYQGLQDLGVTPHYLTDEIMGEMFRIVASHKDNIRADIIFKGGQMVDNWFITGGCGFLGTSLIANIVDRTPNARIVVLDNLTVGTTEDLDEVTDFTIHQASSLQQKTGTMLVQGDIRDYDTVLKCAQGAHCVVHLAANTGVGPSVTDPRADMESNVIGTFNILEACREAKVQKFIFASSGAPAGEVEPPIHEEMAPHPVSPYGASKLAGEGYCSAYYRTFGIETVALRFGNVYGPRSKHKASVVAKFIQEALAGEPCQIYGDGSQTRDFIHIDDLVRALVTAADSEVGGEVFQIASNRERTVLEVAKIIKEEIKSLADIDMRIEHEAKRQGDVMRNFSDTSKAKQMLGWETAASLREGIRETIQYFLSL